MNLNQIKYELAIDTQEATGEAYGNVMDALDG